MKLKSEKEYSNIQKLEKELTEEKERIAKKEEELEKLKNKYTTIETEEDLAKLLSEMKDEIDDLNEKVTKIEEGKKQASTAKKIVKATGISILVIAILAGTYGCISKEQLKKRLSNKANTEDQSDETVGYAFGDIKVNGNSVSDNTITINDEEVEVVVEKESEEEKLNNLISDVANKAYNKVLEERKTNPEFASTIDENVMLELVKYVHHNEDNFYNKYKYNITNESAYNYFNTLVTNSNYNIGILFEGLDIEPYLTKLDNSLINAKDDNDYYDEYVVFQNLGETLDHINLDKYPESLAVVALMDFYIYQPNINKMAGDVVEEQTAAWAEKYNQANETDENGYNDDIDKNKRYECKTIYSYIDRSDSNFMFNKTINDALAEDKNLNNYNSQESIKELGEAIDYSKVDDNYEEIAESFYNSILRYRNTYGNNFAEEITSKNDVVELLYFINQFKDTNIKSTITSKETFESLVDSYYSSCAIYGIEPNMSILFNNYEYGQKKLSEAEKLAANLKNGQGTDYTIPNEYYRWYANNLLYGDDKVLIEDSLKENAPLIAILIEQFKNYRQVGNMLLARQNQKTFDLGVGADGQFVCPDSVDDTIINQRFSEGGHVVGDGNPFQSAYEYIERECNGRSR